MDNKGTTEAEIFVSGMFFKRALLSENKNDIEKYFQIIDNIVLTKDVHNIPAGRKFGVPLMYYHLTNDVINFNKTFNEVLTIRYNYTSRMDYNGTNFDSTIIEHLLLLGRYEEIKIIWVLHLKSKEKFKIYFVKK